MITDKELLEFIDGNLNREEAEQVKIAIESDLDLRNRYEALVSVDSLLSEQSEAQPSGSFVENVMSNLNKRIAVNALDDNSFWKKNLLIVSIIVVVGLVAAITLLSNFTLSEIFPALQPQEITVTNRTISIDPGKFNFINQDLFIKGMIYLNAFVAIFLLEKAVFRPFFRHRRQNYSF